MKVYGEQEYYEELTSKAATVGPGDRMMIATMSFAPGEAEVGRLMDELSGAARRGADVWLLVDAFTFLTNNTQSELGPLVFRSHLDQGYLPPLYRRAYDALQELKQAGGHYVITNLPRRRPANPLAGRSHIKFAVIGDQVFIGSCNLNSAQFINATVGWEDATIADWLWNFGNQVADVGNVAEVLDGQDVRLTSDEGIILVDAGVRNQSLILERAHQFIESAREYIFFTCQYFPDNVTAKRLLKAHQRGVKVQVIYNSPSKHAFPNNLLHQGVKAVERVKLPKSFFAHELARDKKFLHAKLILTEQGAMVGSHNFVNAGVRLGTAEMVVEIPGTSVAKSAEALVRREVGK